MNTEPDICKPVSLGRALRHGFRGAYDNLGYVVSVSLVSFLIASALFSGGALLATITRPGMAGMALFLPAAFAWWMCAVGVFYYANKSVFNEHPVLADTWKGIGLLFWPGAALFCVDLIASVVLAGDTWLLLVVFASRKQFLYVALAILCGYLWMAWSMVAMYHLPLLAAQLNMESGPRVRVILRKSFLLAMDNPGFTVGLFLGIIALAALCVLSAFVGMAMVFIGAAAFLLTHALRELFVKYGIVGEEPEVVEEKPWRLPE